MQVRVAVVDDELFFREAISEVLDAAGIECVTAENGNQALDLAEDETLGVMLLDIRMPGMDGIEVLRRVRERRPTLRVLVLSASTDQETVLEALRLGANDYLAKPLHDEELVHSVRRAAESYALSADAERLRRRLARVVSLTEEISLAAVRMTGDDRREYLCQAAAAGAAELLQAGRTSLLLRDESSGDPDGLGDPWQLRVVAAVGATTPLAEMSPAIVGEGVAGGVAERGEAILVTARSQDERFAEEPDSGRYGSETFVVVPLFQRSVFDTPPAAGALQRSVFDTAPAAGALQRSVFDTAPAAGAVPRSVFDTAPAAGAVPRSVFDPAPAAGALPRSASSGSASDASQDAADSQAGGASLAGGAPFSAGGSSSHAGLAAGLFRGGAPSPAAPVIDESARSLAAAVLAEGEPSQQTFGVLCATEPQGGAPFGAEDLALLRLLAGRVAELLSGLRQRKSAPPALEVEAIESEVTTLHAATGTGSADAELVRGICDALVNEVEPDRVLRAVLEPVERDLRALPVSLYLVDGATGNLVCEAQLDGGYRADRKTLPPASGLTGTVLQSGHLIATQAPDLDARYDPDVDTPEDGAAGPLLCVPLRLRGKVVGLCRAFLPADGVASSATGEVLAAALSAAVRNVLLYRSLVESIEEVAAARRQARR